MNRHAKQRLDRPGDPPGERRVIFSCSLRGGFTLIELLAVIAIIGLLVGLLLPAVQSAREAARRSACMNGVRQMALALLNHQSVNAQFPKGLVCTTGVCDLTGSFDGSFAARSFDWGESFVIRILPFMDSQAVYDQYDFSRPNHWASNREVVSAPLPMLLCPSRDRVNTWGGRTKIHYGGNYGAGRAISETLSWPRTLRGVFDAARQWGASTAHITDGMSQTLLLGEIITDSRESDDSRGAWNFQGGTAFSGGLTVATPSDSHVYARMRGPNAVFTAADAGTKADQTAYCPNQRPQSDTTYYCLDGSYGVAVRSTHPGGVNVALADGSTRFAADSVDLLTWYRLHTIAGREVVGEW
jgi:prepilin-type N-terminal cleavage/methylation domain-containing protein/prepilin-type processing-associated H-X9-DG protein